MHYMSIMCHLHTDPNAVTKRTNVNIQTKSGSSGYVLRDTVIIKRPIRKCRRMFAGMPLVSFSLFLIKGDGSEKSCFLGYFSQGMVYKTQNI